MTAPSPEHDPQHLLERMLFLSDGVFAIVLTLLVLELRVPPGLTDATLFDGLREMTPKFVAFATSFGVVSVFWIGHAATTRRLVKFDWLVACANLVLLFTVAFTPFAASLLGEFGVSGAAWRFYCLTLLVIGLAELSLFLAITRSGGRLIGGPLSLREFWHRLIRASLPAVGFAIALAFSLMGLTHVSYFSWVVIPVILVGARLILNPRRPVTAVASDPIPEG